MSSGRALCQLSYREKVPRAAHVLKIERPLDAREIFQSNSPALTPATNSRHSCGVKATRELGLTEERTQTRSTRSLWAPTSTKESVEQNELRRQDSPPRVFITRFATLRPLFELVGQVQDRMGQVCRLGPEISEPGRWSLSPQPFTCYKDSRRAHAYCRQYCQR